MLFFFVLAEEWGRCHIARVEICVEYEQILLYVESEILSSVIMKFGISWDISPCSRYKKGRFGGMCHLHIGVAPC
jgi:hypothetical protein